MAEITSLFPDGPPTRTGETRSASAEIRNFRGRSRHRDKGCTGTEASREFDRCCPSCDWGAFICSICDGAEGSLPTDCPRVRMDGDQQDAVMQGSADYILSAGGWVRGAYVGGRFRCDGVE